MQAVDLPISKLRRRLRARAVNPAAVAGLVESIREIGIINPLRVRPARIYEDAVSTDGWEITAGVHRHEAAKIIGLEAVPCIVVTDDDLHAELAMIDENLCRAELTPAEAALQTARRKEIYEELHPEAKHGAAGAAARWNADEKSASAFSEATAEATGRSRRSVQIDAARGEALGDALADIAGTSLDKGVELDALAKLPADDRKQIIQRAVAGEDVSARPVKLADPPLNDFESKEKQVAALMAAWNRAGPEAREEFLSRIDQPLMDRRYGT